jgi:flagellar biosynthesis protein FlhG
MTALSNPSSNTGRSAAAPQVADKRLTIASGKGGVGKTWFAITLSQALAYTGEHVLLVDGDLGLANVDVQLGITPTADLASVVSGKVALDDAITPYRGGSGLHGTTPPERGGFDVLPGRSGSGALGNMSRMELTGLSLGLDALSGHYDRIVVDLSAGVDQAVTTLSAPSESDPSAAAHTLIVVLNDEPTSLTDAYAFIKLMNLRGQSDNIRIVVNLAESESAGTRTYETILKVCRNFLGVEPPLLGIIHRDTKIRDAIQNQVPLLTRHPQSQAAKDVTAIANRLTPKI